MTLMAHGPESGATAPRVLVPSQHAPERAGFVAPETTWRASLTRAAIGVDLALLCLAGLAAQLAPSSGPIGNPGYALAVGLAWWAFLSFSRAHEPRFLGDGPEEF